MIDYRFTGRIGSDYEYVDIRFRTDAISNDDNAFNITQIQKGQDFSINDKQDEVYQKWLSSFKETNSSKAEMVQFAMDNDLDLRSYKDGVETVVYNDNSASLSTIS